MDRYEYPCWTSQRDGYINMHFSDLVLYIFFNVI